MREPLVERRRDGLFELRLEAEERGLLGNLPGQLREPLDEGDDAALRRLFPPAYLDDAARDAEYHRYMREDLERTHREALDVLETTVQAETLTAEQLHAWVRAINQLRLVLGTRLDVTEDLDYEDIDDDDPRAPAYSLYAWLSWIQDESIEALGDP